MVLVWIQFRVLNLFLSPKYFVCIVKTDCQLTSIYFFQRPKRKPLSEFFVDDDDNVLTSPPADPNAPRPEGNVISPAVGEQLTVSLLGYRLKPVKCANVTRINYTSL